ncbi:MAG: iron ABC transporter permease [Gammaproteobacteria bacterium]|nr:iron ABC transporter permease [Gammaproteobacteria bacterium]
MPVLTRPETAVSGTSVLAWSPWVTAAVIALPMLCLPWLAAFPEENIWPHLLDTVLPRYVGTTLLLMLGVGVGVFVLGVSTAWLVTMCRFPGRALFRWSLLLPLAMPAYLVAYIYTDLLEFAGPVQHALREMTGWTSARQYWFPHIRSLGGAVLVMTLVLYPYVYMLARSAFLTQSVAALEAGRLLGASAFGAFVRVALPSARPAIAVGVALALMETLNDFGTVDYFGVQTLSAGVYDVWLNMGNLGGAAQIAVVMLAFVIALVAVERFSRRRQAHHMTKSNQDPLPEYALSGLRAVAASGFCASIVILGFALPAGVLLSYVWAHPGAGWSAELGRFAFNSVSLATGAAVITVGVGMLLAYSTRLRPIGLTRVVVRVASLGYAVPGAVLAIGILVTFAGIDNAVDAAMRQWFGVSTGLLLSGTGFAVLFAYVVRFLAIPAAGIESSLAKITPSMDMASRTLGEGAQGTFRRVHLPLIRGGVLAASTIVFVDCMKELPATLMLRPFNFDTLATHLYQFASDEQIEAAALGALIIVLVGLAPVIILNRAIERTRSLVRSQANL